MEQEIPLQTPIEIARLEDDLRLTGVAFLAFTRPQLKSIRARDHGRCNFPETEGHRGRLHVHHIIPKSLESRTGVDPDNPILALTICEAHHFLIHNGDDENAEYLRTEKGMVCWNDSWDAEMISTSLSNTREAIKGGWKFPKK